MKLTNTSLLTRLLTGFGAILALSCLLGLIALQKLETVSGLTEDLHDHSLAVATSVLEANAGIIAMHRSMKDVALAQDAAGIDSAAQAVDASEKQVFAAMAVAQERFLGDKNEFDETLKAIRDWQPIRADVIRAMKAGDRETGATITKTKGAAQVKLIAERMDALVAGVKQRAASFADVGDGDGSAGQDPGDIGARRHDRSGPRHRLGDHPQHQGTDRPVARGHGTAGQTGLFGRRALYRQHQRNRPDRQGGRVLQGERACRGTPARRAGEE